MSFSRGAVYMAAALVGSVEKPWLTLAGPFLSFLSQTGVENALLPL